MLKPQILQEIKLETLDDRYEFGCCGSVCSGPPDDGICPEEIDPGNSTPDECGSE